MRVLTQGYVRDDPCRLPVKVLALREERFDRFSICSSLRSLHTIEMFRPRFWLTAVEDYSHAQGMRAVRRGVPERQQQCPLFRWIHEYLPTSPGEFDDDRFTRDLSGCWQ